MKVVVGKLLFGLDRKQGTLRTTCMFVVCSKYIQGCLGMLLQVQCSQGYPNSLFVVLG